MPTEVIEERLPVLTSGYTYGDISQDRLHITINTADGPFLVRIIDLQGHDYIGPTVIYLLSRGGEIVEEYPIVDLY